MSHFVSHLCRLSCVYVNCPVSSQVAFQDFLSVNCLGLGRFFCPLLGVGLGPRFFISIGGPDTDLPGNFYPIVVPGCEAGRIPACAGGHGGEVDARLSMDGAAKKYATKSCSCLTHAPLSSSVRREATDTKSG